MTVITRFAPSPTGFLHIGGARTALFNYLYAKKTGGTFLLRIEDTDKKRSNAEATTAILDSLQWLGLNHDGDAIYQSQQEPRHVEIAKQLLAEGNAYHCYCSKEELAEMRAKAESEKRVFRYDRKWRDKSASDAPTDIKPVIRFKAPLAGETVINDHVQGEVRIPNSEMDDFVILRDDETPTYMLAVVVDDHDMGVNHIIRGNDHLTNSFKQQALYHALGWDVPAFTHVPLIHGADGAKLSKRHGALGAESYREMGYLPEAMNNYLLRLGWSHGDDEIINREQATEWFDVEHIGKSPARFDVAKLNFINNHYLKSLDDQALLEATLPFIGTSLDDEQMQRLQQGLATLKDRCNTLVELAEKAQFYIASPAVFDEKAQNILTKEAETLEAFIPVVESLTAWDYEMLKACIANFVKARGIKFPANRHELTCKTDWHHTSA